jgi:hypothetical protein
LAPEVGFRRSMAGLCTPLSTLRIDPRGPLRMTRGRCRSLNLHRKGLAPSTSCLSPGAPVCPIRWRQEYGGLKSDQVTRLKELETENAHLRKAVSDLTLEKLILKEAASGNW